MQNLVGIMLGRSSKAWCYAARNQVKFKILTLLLRYS